MTDALTSTKRLFTVLIMHCVPLFLMSLYSLTSYRGKSWIIFHPGSYDPYFGCCFEIHGFIILVECILTC